MSYTKQQFIELAFEEIGFGFPYSLMPEQLQKGLYKLDSMMAQWNTKGIRLGYPIPSSPKDSNLNDDTTVFDSANEAIYLNLAIRLAPSFGKQLSIEVKQSAKTALNALYSRSAQPQERQITDLPRGAGNKSWRYNDNEFLSEPTDPLLAGPDSEFEFD